MSRTLKVYLALAGAYVALVVLANWLASRYVWPVPLTPYEAPAGVFAIGGILVARDWLQQAYGLPLTMPLVYLAGFVSWGVGDLAGWTTLQKIAVASIVAFTASETLEALVFTPLRRRFAAAVALSATAGAALDSWLFLTIAFGSTAYFWGNFWGKVEMVVLGTIVTVLRRRVVPATASA